MYAQLACILEATARKPGNVHRFRDFDDAHYLDFVVAASALGPTLTPEHIGQFGLGRAMRDAVEETGRLVGHNVNLGMILLLGPLAVYGPGMKDLLYPDRIIAYWGFDHPAAALRVCVASSLRQTTVDDAREVYAAIRLARPGGLGSAPEQDVAGEPTVTLLDAMALAAGRDAIARQYENAYADVFLVGYPALCDALAAGRPLETAIVLAHLTLMARLPDTLIARKRGDAVAGESARRAAEVLASGWPDAPGSADELAAFDAWLRADGHARNPGATADLVAASLFVALWDEAIELPKHLNRPGWDGADHSR